MLRRSKRGLSGDALLAEARRAHARPGAAHCLRRGRAPWIVAQAATAASSPRPSAIIFIDTYTITSSPT